MTHEAPPEHNAQTPLNTNTGRLSSNGGTCGSPR